MVNLTFIDSGLHWTAVILYAVATIFNTTGVIFRKEKAERISYSIVVAGLLVHGAALIARWIAAAVQAYYEWLPIREIDPVPVCPTT